MVLRRRSASFGRRFHGAARLAFFRDEGARARSGRAKLLHRFHRGGSAAGMHGKAGFKRCPRQFGEFLSLFAGSLGQAAPALRILRGGSFPSTRAGCRRRGLHRRHRQACRLGLLQGTDRRATTGALSFSLCVGSDDAESASFRASLTGTGPAAILREDTGKVWRNASMAFQGASDAIRAQVPSSWGGTMTDPTA